MNNNSLSHRVGVTGPTMYSVGDIYHICNKSIANYGIFNTSHDTERYLSVLEYSNNQTNKLRMSYVLRRNSYSYKDLLTTQNSPKVKFLAYCIMPDHYHLLLKVIDSSISDYIGRVENAYTRYFNTKYKRKGPLWQSRYRRVRVDTDSQLLHVSRYIHINPYTSGYVSKPEDWKYSSYRNYLDSTHLQQLTEISINNPDKYKAFCENQLDYQKTLKQITRLNLD